MIVTDSGGTHEIVDDGESGFVVAGGDWRAVADRLLQILQSPDLGRQLVGQAMVLCGLRGASSPACLRAAGVRYDRIIATDWKDNLRVVLVATRNPLNIGAAARAMANFGFSRLRVVHPYDVAFREARSAVGAAPLLHASEEFSTLADAVADCALVVGTTSVGHRELQHPIRRLEYGARLLGRL